jgi:ABC-type antimicrobial peptide transport system permease subunit
LKIPRILHNEYVKSAIVIVAIIGVVLGFFFGLQIALNSSVPVRVVESGSMCVSYSYACDGWSHPFDQTLHVGDIIIIQGVNPADLNTNYPNSDVIVYLNPDDTSATPIVHRIVDAENIDGKLYFQTKGDGNGQRWPAIPSPNEYDSQTLWRTGDGKGLPQELVVGKVAMRIPYFGWITLFLRENSWGLPLIVALILLLVVLEFVIPIIKSKRTQIKESKEETK